MATKDIVLLNPTSSKLEAQQGTDTVRIKGDSSMIFSVERTTNERIFGVATETASIVSPAITASGAITMSGTGSFGRMEATLYQGDASTVSFTLPENLVSSSVQLGSNISGSWGGDLSQSEFTYPEYVAGTESGLTFVSGGLTGSVSSTASFGRVEADIIVGDASQLTNLFETDTISGSTQLRTTISGSWQSYFSSSDQVYISGGVSSSITQTSSFGHVVANSFTGDGSGITKSSFIPDKAISSSIQIGNQNISGSWQGITSGSDQLFISGGLTSSHGPFNSSSFEFGADSPLSFFKLGSTAGYKMIYNSGSTMGAWIKIKGPGYPNSENRGEYAITGDDQQNRQFHISSNNNTNYGKVNYLNYPYTKGGNATSTTRLTADEWHWVVVATRDRNGFGGDVGIRIYVDGRLDGTGELGNSSTDQPFEIDQLGHKGSFTGNAVMDGFITEFAVWDTALSSSMIEELYNAGNGADAMVPRGTYTAHHTASLHLYYRMGDPEETSGGQTVPEYNGSRWFVPNIASASYVTASSHNMSLTSSVAGLGNVPHSANRFETVVANTFTGDGTALTNVLPAGFLSSSEQWASEVTGAWQGILSSSEQLLISGGVSSSAARASSFSKVEANTLVGDGSALKGIFTSGEISSSVQIQAELTGSSHWGNVSTASLTTILTQFNQDVSPGGSPTFNTVQVSGSIRAATMILSSSTSFYTSSKASGSTNMGNSTDDIHSFTGSLFLSGAHADLFGNVSSTSTASFAEFAGDATGLIFTGTTPTASFVDPLDALRAQDSEGAQTGSFTIPSGVTGNYSVHSGSLLVNKGRRDADTGEALLRHNIIAENTNFQYFATSGSATAYQSGSTHTTDATGSGLTGYDPISASSYSPPSPHGSLTHQFFEMWDGLNYRPFITGSVQVGERAVTVSGYQVYNAKGMTYLTISHGGTTVDFGEISGNAGLNNLGAMSNGVNERGVTTTQPTSPNNKGIEFITISTPSNATDFGLLAFNKLYQAASSGTNDRGIFSGKEKSTAQPYQYVTISTTGNAAAFGDSFQAGTLGAMASNGTNGRALQSAGSATTGIDRKGIEFLTMHTLSNALDFADMTVANLNRTALSNDTNNRALFLGGATINTIDYVDVSTIANATDFGDLAGTNVEGAATSNGTNDRGVVMGKGEPGKRSISAAAIEFVTISTPGNAIVYGENSNLGSMQPMSNGAK
jgi:hypothetical protein